MNRWISAPAVIAAAAILSSCGASSTPSAFGTGVAPLGRGGIAPFKACAGTNGVTVEPCPVHLNRHTKDGIVVTVKGPGVVNSYLDSLNGCFNRKLCYNAERHGNSYTKWRFTPGQSCGNAAVEFDAVNASGGEVGSFSLKVTNKYCP
jgi:hypothetical protein